MKTKAQQRGAVIDATQSDQDTRRPFVFINMAMTADGKIATANRAISSFGSRHDLNHLYELRTTADAIIAGARTLDLNKVLLGNGGERYRRMRLRRGLSEYPLRIIVSGSGTINPRAAIFAKAFSPIILLTTQRGSRRLQKLRAVVQEIVVCGEADLDFAAALRHLASRWKIRRLLCEGGGELNSALFRAGLVDELNLTICPKIFGGRLAPTIAEGNAAPTLAEAASLRLHSMRQFGDEVFFQFRA